jgi:transposase
MPETSYLYVGLDTHKRSTRSAVLIEAPSSTHADLGPGSYDERTLPWQPDRVATHLLKLQEKYGRPVHACYEAGNIGYGLCRAIQSAGLKCEVVAPSRTPREGSDRKKTDARDARKLARYLASGHLVTVYVPTEEEEADRALVRTRSWTLVHLQRSKILVDALLTQHSRLYEKTADWKTGHWKWLMSQRFAQTTLQQAYDHLLETVTLNAQQLTQVETSIEELAATQRHRQAVLNQKAFLGIQTTAAMVLNTELPAIERFDKASDATAFVGLTPSESSSGDTVRRGRITKQGNARIRKVLIQAAWNYMRAPRVSADLKRRRDQVPPWVAQCATRAAHRLHKKFHRVAACHPRQVAVVAVARELLGFLWCVRHPDGEAMHNKRCRRTTTRPTFMGKTKKQSDLAQQI